ncbi:MAG: NAD(P)/FAD-dependent oxidoreductase [Dehalococcoidia bacterium]|nr:NAD(P)/FAD-dependent oxidoreductase [Dehalococcoidia bacterium]
MYDAVIVGAGPTGSYIAHRLASLGHKVVVFEEHERIGEPVQCTGIIGAECLERFPLFDGTVVGEVSSARLFSPSRKELRLWRESVQAYIVDRAALDRSLAEKAQGKGAHYLPGSRVKDIAVLDDRVMVETEGQETCEAKTAVIASGFDSRIPQKLGLGRVGDLIIGAQAEVSIDGHSELEVYFDQRVAPGFFAWFVPTVPKRALVGLFSRRKPGRHLRMLLATLFQQGMIASPEVKITYRGIPLKPLPKTYRERVIVVGDAAGQVKPTTGGGVYYGLLCAEVATDTLHQALATDTFSEKLFSGYQEAWQEKIGWELRIGYFARSLYERLTDHQIDYLFHLIASKGIHESLLQSPELSFDWHGKAIVEGLKYLGPKRQRFNNEGKA